MLNSDCINNCILKTVQGIGRTRTSLSRFKEILVPVPPKEEQLSIANAIRTYNKLFHKMAKCL